MSGIYAIFIKELKTELRYRVVWINTSLTPFFIIAPYVFTGKGINQGLEGEVLVGTIIWYWLNQYFFGFGDTFINEREQGTLVNIAISPLSLLGFLVGKGLWFTINSMYITVITIILFRVVGIQQGTSLLMIAVYVCCGAYMFAFSIFFSALTLKFKRLTTINYGVQEVLGLVSGMTTKVTNFPKALQAISNIIPLTYAIYIGRLVLENKNIVLILTSTISLTIISLIYLCIGVILLNRVQLELRRKGEWELW